MRRDAWWKEQVGSKESIVSKGRFGILCAALLALSALLVGCAAGPHQVIDVTEECSSCHSDDKPTYEEVVPEGAEQVAPTVAVGTSADTVSVCEPIFTEEDGSYFVPRVVRTVPVSDGSATVELEAGTWALSLDQGDTATSKLVTVAEGGAEHIDL